MIVGIGNDIVDIRRIQIALNKHPRRFPMRLLSNTEQQHPRASEIQYLASRWAAKEALGKALGCGVRAPMTLQQITVLNDNKGKPFFIFTDSGKQYLNACGVRHCHLSIAHDGDYAAAFVITEQ